MLTPKPLRAKRIWMAAMVAAALPLAASLAAAQDAPPVDETTPEQAATPSAEQPRMEADISAELLEKGFIHLYELKFNDARSEFLAYQKARPEDPLGKAAEAACYLFEEFNAKGVLTSEFFLDDNRFLGGVEGKPSENRNNAFLAANHEARGIAKKSVKSNPHDTHGLLVLTITDGMESNYAALIEKKQLPALSFMRQAESEANALLAVDPDQKDAYVALGMSNYVIGCLPGYKKAFLWFGGVHGDRNRGIQQMKSASEEGHYLKPFAKILLALAYEREHQTEHAQPLLVALTVQFPTNPIFARELALIEKKECCSKH